MSSEREDPSRILSHAPEKQKPARTPVYERDTLDVVAGRGGTKKGRKLSLKRLALSVWQAVRMHAQRGAIHAWRWWRQRQPSADALRAAFRAQAVFVRGFVRRPAHVCRQLASDALFGPLSVADLRAHTSVAILAGFAAATLLCAFDALFQRGSILLVLFLPALALSVMALGFWGSERWQLRRDDQGKDVGNNLFVALCALTMLLDGALLLTPAWESPVAILTIAMLLAWLWSVAALVAAFLRLSGSSAAFAVYLFAGAASLLALTPLLLRAEPAASTVVEAPTEAVPPQAPAALPAPPSPPAAASAPAQAPTAPAAATVTEEALRPHGSTAPKRPRARHLRKHKN